MPKLPEKNELADWQRYFAIECNNTAWDLLGKERTPERSNELLNTAHAAAYHWQAAGSELNHMRAKMLLAETHASLGMGETALRYSNEVHAFFTGRETEDWELAFTYAIHAHALHAAGDLAGHGHFHGMALEAISAIEDEESRAIVQETFVRVPTPA